MRVGSLLRETENPEEVSNIGWGSSDPSQNVETCCQSCESETGFCLRKDPLVCSMVGQQMLYVEGLQKNWQECDVVLVELAHGSVELKQDPLTGTILTEHAVEPIVPLRGLIELGSVIKWGAQGCEIKHPSRGTIQCWLRNGCPVVSEKLALGLIHDAESMELAKTIPVNTPENMSEECC